MNPYIMAREVAEGLISRGYPVEVLYGNTRLSSAVGVVGRRIVVERDRRGPEAYGSFPGGQPNPRPAGVRGLAIVATVYAQSLTSGAKVEDHEYDCDRLVDAFFSELVEWCSDAGTDYPEVVEARMLGQDDFPPGGWPPGAVYRLRFRVKRAIVRRDYDGDAEPTGMIEASAGTFSAVRVSRDGVTYESVPLGGEE